MSTSEGEDKGRGVAASREGCCECHKRASCNTCLFIHTSYSRLKLSREGHLALESGSGEVVAGSTRFSAEGPSVVKSDCRVDTQTTASWQTKEEAHPLQLQPHAWAAGSMSPSDTPCSGAILNSCVAELNRAFQHSPQKWLSGKAVQQHWCSPCTQEQKRRDSGRGPWRRRRGGGPSLTGYH